MLIDTEKLHALLNLNKAYGDTLGIAMLYKFEEALRLVEKVAERAGLVGGEPVVLTVPFSAVITRDERVRALEFRKK